MYFLHMHYALSRIKRILHILIRHVDIIKDVNTNSARLINRVNIFSINLTYLLII